MELFLSASDDDLKNKFHNLETSRDVATLLEVKYSDLTYYLYRRKFSENYKSFQLFKKSGGYRKILSPVSSLKIIQTKLNYILQHCCPK
jgi:RNA-directed DNA polymerase